MCTINLKPGVTWETLPAAVPVGPDLDKIALGLDQLQADLMFEYEQLQPGKLALAVEVIECVRDLVGLPSPSPVSLCWAVTFRDRTR